jgi:hypothetical protein
MAPAKSGKQQLGYISAGHRSTSASQRRPFKHMTGENLVYIGNLPTALQHIQAGDNCPFGTRTKTPIQEVQTVSELFRMDGLVDPPSSDIVCPGARGFGRSRI